MKRRIVSIICIMFLLFTITSPISGGFFSYAEDNITLPTQQQKIDLGMMTYYNYRKGWFTSQTPSAVPALLVRYASEFFESSSNNTGINSMSELAATISLDRDSGHWKVTISNQGLTFLDNLTKWMLGKNDFPNLYSGGSWGTGGTLDSAYRGLITGDALYYVIPNASFTTSDTQSGLYHTSDITVGGAVRGISGNILLDEWLDLYPNVSRVDFFDQNKSNSDLGLTTANKLTVTINYFSDVSKELSFVRGRRTDSDNLSRSPALNFNSGTTIQHGLTNITPGILFSSGAYAYRSHRMYGKPAYILAQNSSGVNYLFTGWAVHDVNDDLVLIRTFNRIVRNDYPNDISDANVDLRTNDFDKQDLSGDPDDPDTPASLTFTPVSGRDPSINNTYNQTTVNNFYNEYVTNYTEYNSSVINEGDIINPDPDDPDDPDEPDTPGGTTPPWDNSSGAGTLTPDGNGGYTFNLPDLTIPDLNIDWNLRGLSEKFPFSIPWDLMAFFTVLNAEPETPAIEAQIDLGIVDWDIDWDLHNFDTLAALLRNLEFIGFCLALILITRSIIKG